MTVDLKDFFSAIGKAKQEKVDEVRSLVGEIDIDSMFSQVKVSIEEDNKKKKEQKKQIAALESWLYAEVIEEKEIVEESTTIVVPDKEVVEEIEEEVVEEIEEIEEVVEEVVEEIEEEVVEDDNTVDQALKILETIKSKEEIRENVSDPEIIKIRRELEYLKNLVNAQGGGGEVRLEFLDDVDRDSIKVDGKVLSYQASTGKFIGVTNSGEGGGGGLSNAETISTGVKITGDLVVTGEVLASTEAPIVTTTTSTSQTALDTFAHSTYASAVYNIQATSGSDVHLTTINLIHDGSDAYITEFATLKIGSLLASYSADISGLNLRILATPASTNSTVFTLKRTLIRGTGNTGEVTTTSTTETTIDEFSTSSGSSAVYIVQAKQGSDVHTSKIHLVHDGTTVSMTEFAKVKTGSSLGTFDADISGSNVRLRATSTSATSTTYNVSRTLL
tara:strand:+ start:1372 stop:2709 length:1338 start_codon:yes stop_codon:yes gene_type:complete